ncbi:MAG: hypothetical protein P5702_10625 [Limnospira sp. PMC 1291.21]|uniref:hypothetical protein n=1 Tax=unclassified Limnospira TaxID=2642885 RepID=UPI0028E120AB|nr:MULTISPECIES: hypothetical protein [unclassified Limnospira]MDT9179452.1 hypothetical protein [Limnospira sp. PMC 1238.20]MDT9194693.1 hypothetical protein [Limnospira sp. PMC 1245.20]MDT9205051.1 hypothetical protein [Limnospira sp. PMC 1243.20]MDT9210095.1 hypothetical protein [Limnospira sp. PMC 1252.20]MDT9220467.1 hypothetical protein [Limnospira sp. PMC 1240.20]
MFYHIPKAKLTTSPQAVLEILKQSKGLDRARHECTDYDDLLKRNRLSGEYYRIFKNQTNDMLMGVVRNYLREIKAADNGTIPNDKDEIRRAKLQLFNTIVDDIYTQINRVLDLQNPNYLESRKGRVEQDIRKLSENINDAKRLLVESLSKNLQNIKSLEQQKNMIECSILRLEIEIDDSEGFYHHNYQLQQLYAINQGRKQGLNQELTNLQHQINVIKKNCQDLDTQTNNKIYTWNEKRQDKIREKQQLSVKISEEIQEVKNQVMKGLNELQELVQQEGSLAGMIPNNLHGLLGDIGIKWGGCLREYENSNHPR